MAERRWLDPAAAAAYISVRPDALQRLVRQGRIPKPSYHLGSRSPRWDIKDLDNIFLTGERSTNAELACQAGVEEILAEGRRKGRTPHPGGR